MSKLTIDLSELLAALDWLITPEITNRIFNNMKYGNDPKWLGENAAEIVAAFKAKTRELEKQEGE